MGKGLLRRQRGSFSFLCLVLLVVARSSLSYAQAKPATPPTEKHQASSPSVAPATLSAPKVEEALRLLLNATATKQEGPTDPQLQPELDGLVIDQTVTKIGHDFYSLFYEQWELPTAIGEYLVVIRERPSRGIGALIAIEVNDNSVVEMPLSPNYEAIEEAVAYGLSLTIERLVTARKVSQQLEKAVDDPGTEVY